MKIVISFFGITRSLKHTVSSIKENILSPARNHGEVSVVAHYFDLPYIKNVRTGEDFDLDTNEHSLLKYDKLVIEKPQECLEKWQFDKIASYGDAWNDSFSSLKNLIHQLHSLDTATSMATEFDPDLVIFCRPDLEYHDSFEKVLRFFSKKRFNGAVIPFWQWWGGYNDRFAFCGRDAIRDYGCRARSMNSFLERSTTPLHSEKLLRFSLNQSNVPVRVTDLRASRVRANGQRKDETFSGKDGMSLRDTLYYLKRV
ncbi:hypothetical protein [Paraburkholderia caffeinilytica]|uniref:hypothetical protein n=1 Tax=Paraburkholderia caffeinilytica TaxID=1761016 RepID=UPI000E20FE3C|nr:hypothetical protein [Paraburkholderia caffeinilytica]CAB3804558.1 hypothetical protein LMG28690_06056 [Paraburkholderia caffeinilytica]